MTFCPNNHFRKGLNQAAMQENVKVIAPIMLSRGYSRNAIAAMLGNWESECTLNPNWPEKSGFPSNREGGFGFPQWTDWGNKIGWYADQLGVQYNTSDTNPISEIEFELDYHEFECTKGLKGTGKKTWYAKHGYNYTWTNFRVSLDSPSELAKAYYWQYERSTAWTVGTRAKQAEKWFEFIRGTQPQTKKRNFLLLAYKAGVLNVKTR